MQEFEKDYAYQARYIDLVGQERQTRNSVTKSTFGLSLAFDELIIGRFPLIQGRQMFWRGIVGELATFLQGPKNVAHFKTNGCNYWDAWGDKDGKLNVDYGNSWLDFNGANQLKMVVEGLQKDPYGRRHVITGWNPSNLDKLSLPCCHLLYQWYVTNDKRLEMLWYQRSADWMIGVPSDIVLAALFNLLMAQTVGLKPGRVIMQFGDAHIYKDHYEPKQEYDAQVFNYTSVATYRPPVRYELDPDATVFNFVPSMFNITRYEHGPKINFPLIP